MKLIRTEPAYEGALQRIDELWDAARDTPECDELEVLSMLVERYEEQHHKIPPPHPVAAILFAMEQRGLRRKDLEVFIGPSGRVSEILAEKRPLTLDMIRRLHVGMKIPSDVLIADYLGKS